jgi:tetratricopeptide (TPR) repeat protein
MKRLRVSLLCIGMLTIGHARACLWDTDTLAMERARFPATQEVIAGNFPRHSPEFYRWRKARCEAALANDPNQPALYDDLAVAQHKLGDHRAAIETMQAKEKVAPGLYETYSNLGTFYIYTGDLDEALRWIDKALAINPNAHFGREQYQKWLIEWLNAGKPQGEDSPAEMHVPPMGFALFIGERSRFKTWKDSLRPSALAGILGMMRFADFDNPLLLEALGDVLCAGKFEDNASLLAAEAYLLASRKSSTAVEKQRLWKKMERAGQTVDNFRPKSVADALNASLATGGQLAAKVRTEEMAWIKAGKDAGAEFQKRYLPATKD